MTSASSGTWASQCQIGDIFIIQASNFSDITISNVTDVTASIKASAEVFLYDLANTSWKAYKATSRGVVIKKNLPETGLRLIIQLRNIS